VTLEDLLRAAEAADERAEVAAHLAPAGRIGLGFRRAVEFRDRAAALRKAAWVVFVERTSTDAPERR
jgi:hypothetical protein